MSFLVYEKFIVDGKPKLRPTNELFSLAGYNLIYKAWKSLGEPKDQGWHINADELIKLHYGSQQDYSTRRLLIDFDPSSTGRIGIVELLDVYAYTYKNSSDGVEWTPLMLRLRDVFYDEYQQELAGDQRLAIVSNLDEPDPASDDILEFLYINGDHRGWNWGKNGMTNAVFLHKKSRDYFRQFF